MKSALLQYLEKKDELDLKCEILKKDSKMYCSRMEDILKQLDEVIKERDKVTWWHFELCSVTLLSHLQTMYHI